MFSSTALRENEVSAVLFFSQFLSSLQLLSAHSTLCERSLEKAARHTSSKMFHYFLYFVEILIFFSPKDI